MKNGSQITKRFAQAAQTRQDTTLDEPASNAAQSQQAEQTVTVSFRVTKAEKAQLERDCVGLSRSAYIRDKLFESAAKPRRTRGKHPVKDYEALGRLLGLLGRSGVSKALDEIAVAVRAGQTGFDPATTALLHTACNDVSYMRDQLVIGLGLKQTREP